MVEADEIDFARVRGNIEKFIDLGGTDQEVDIYLASKGVTREYLRATALREHLRADYSFRRQVVYWAYVSRVLGGSTDFQNAIEVLIKRNRDLQRACDSSFCNVVRLTAPKLAFESKMIQQRIIEPFVREELTNNGDRRRRTKLDLSPRSEAAAQGRLEEAPSRTCLANESIRTE